MNKSIKKYLILNAIGVTLTIAWVFCAYSYESASGFGLWERIQTYIIVPTLIIWTLLTFISPISIFDEKSIKMPVRCLAVAFNVLSIPITFFGLAILLLSS